MRGDDKISEANAVMSGSIKWLLVLANFGCLILRIFDAFSKYYTISTYLENVSKQNNELNIF